MTGHARVEPEWCNSWTSYDDVTGEGWQTFEHECGREAGHDGDHTCMGHTSDWDGWHETCSITWHNYGRTHISRGVRTNA